MYSGKYVKLDMIIDKVYRNTGYTDELSLDDCIEWTAEAIAATEVSLAYIDKVTNGLNCNPAPVEIIGFRGELPCDIVDVIAVREWNSKIGMVQDTDLFHSSQISNTLEVTVIPSTTTDNTRNGFLPAITAPPTLSAPKTGNSNLAYKLNDNYIFTNFETGFVEIAYLAYPIDENGLPLIPDNDKMIKAVVAYITERVDYRLYRQNKITPALYQHSERERNFYCGSAHNSMSIPNMDGMEALKRSLKKIILPVNAHITGFRYSKDTNQVYTYRY